GIRMTLGGAVGRGGRIGVALLRGFGVGCRRCVALRGGLRFRFRGVVTLRGGLGFRRCGAREGFRAARCLLRGVVIVEELIDARVERIDLIVQV
ncbi:hypothetical protein ACO1L2_13620, partial [Staphylococcus aureus]